MSVHAKQDRMQREEDGGVFEKKMDICVHVCSYVKLEMWRHIWHSGIQNMKRCQPFASLHPGY